MSTTIEDRIKETHKFITELWGICDPKWVVEIDLLQYKPTLENPDDKRMSAVFYTVDQVFRDWPTIHKMLEARNRNEVENIHQNVNCRQRRPAKHGKNSDVQFYTSLWVDVDFHDNEKGVRKQFYEMIEALKKRGLGPSIIVESGRGLHAYWLLLRPVPVSEARPICAGIQDDFKISDAVHDPRRVLRLPGFLNLKDPKDPKWCKVIDANWKRYPIEVFKGFAIEPGLGEEEREDEEDKKGAVRTISRDPRIEEIKSEGVDEGGGPYGGRHNSAVALAGHYAAKGLPKRSIIYTMKEWNTEKNNPSLDEDELVKIIEDIWVKDQVRRAEEGPAQKQEKEASAKDKARAKRTGKPWFDDDGNFSAPILAQWFLREYNFLSTPIAENGEGVTLYKYEKGVFLPDGASFIRQEACRHLGNLSSKERMNEVLHMLTEYSKCRYETVNPTALNLINLKNGMLDWHTGTLHKHDPDHKSLIQINADYDPKAESEELDAFFKAVFPEDCIPLVCEFMGYLLIPSTSLQKAFVAIGGGGNGKGTFLKILSHLIGEENISTISLHEIQENKFATAGLLGKLGNFYHDLDPNILKSTGKFKSIVSGDPIAAERKFKDHYSFVPFARLVFSANEFPRSVDKTAAYFDRLIFVEFPNRFRHTSKQILDYDEILIKKPNLISALLNKALAGLQRLMKQQRFTESATSSRAIEAYKRECSNALDFMIECCEKKPESFIPRKQLYQKYSGWCEEQGMRPVSAKNFAKSARDFGAQEHKREGIRMWTEVRWMDGIAPKTDQDEIAGFGSPQKSDGPGSDF